MSDLAIGIDLGTTYCCMAVYRDGDIEIIPNEVDKNTSPSFVHIDKDKFVTAGPTAKGLALQDPTTSVYDVKRLIGRCFNDPLVQKDMKIWPFKVIEDEDTHFPRILLHETSYVPEEISAHVLEYLKQCAEEYLGCSVKQAVITVPAYFTEQQRHLTKLAGTMAGLKVLKLLNEPTAAAVTFCYKNKSFQTARTILVFDLGGGTFDIVVMTIKDRKIQIKAIGGDSHLGGQDIDRNLVDYCLKEFKTKHNIDLTLVGPGRDEVKVARLLRRLKNECEEIKTQLSRAKRCVISLDNVHGDINLVVQMTREKFENLNNSLFQKCVNTVKTVVEKSKLSPADVDEVIMVGGSSRIPKLQELVMGLFPGKTLNRTIKADEAVASGAAIQASLMTADCPALKNIFRDTKIYDEVSATVDHKQLEVKPLVAQTLKDAMEKARGIRTKYHKQMLSLKTHDDSEGDCRKEMMTHYMSLINLDENPNAISMLLEFIERHLFKKDWDDALEFAWRAVRYLLRYKPGNCERFLKHRGIEVFLNGLNAFPNKLNFKTYSIRSLLQVAGRKRWRPKLMKSELINVFFNFLDSTEDDNWISYKAADFLTQILSDREAAWKIESPRRADVLRGIRRNIERWEDQSFRLYYSSLKTFLNLLNVTHTAECQLFAAYVLKNITKVHPEFHVPILLKAGGMDILKTIKCKDTDIRKYVDATLKQCNEYLSVTKLPK